MFKKTLSLFLACVVITSLLTSCKKKEEKITDIESMVISMAISFECENPTIAGIFDQLNSNKTTIYYEDGQYKAVNNQEIFDGTDTVIFNTVYTVSGNLIFCHNTISINDVPSRNSESRAKINDEQKQTFLKKLTVMGIVSVEDFSDVTREKNDGKTVEIYKSPNIDGTIALKEMMLSLLENACDNLSLGNVTFTVETEDGKYLSATLMCDYDVTIAELTCPVRTTVSLDFDYAAEFNIDVPENFLNYPLVNVEKITG